jgi:TonB family protein
LTIPSMANRFSWLLSNKPLLKKEGINAFTNSIKQKVRYSEEAKRLGLRGKVYVKFVIKKDGTATDFEIVKGISKELDLEALRFLQAEIKGWNPAKQNGKIVNSQIVLPVQFGE